MTKCIWESFSYCFNRATEVDKLTEWKVMSKYVTKATSGIDKKTILAHYKAFHSMYLLYRHFENHTPIAVNYPFEFSYKNSFVRGSIPVILMNPKGQYEIILKHKVSNHRSIENRMAVAVLTKFTDQPPAAVYYVKLGVNSKDIALPTMTKTHPDKEYVERSVRVISDILDGMVKDASYFNEVYCEHCQFSAKCRI